MTEVKSIHNAEHYTWGDGCDGWHLLRSKGLSVIQEKMPPGTSELLHFHSNAQQLFYILSGVATFTVGEKTIVVHSGESIHIPEFVKHSVANKNTEALELLVISQPESHGDRQNIQP
jgi:mannose-6-phosphate isomerase-like protein (cupin superfamily)